MQLPLLLVVTLHAPVRRLKASSPVQGHNRRDGFTAIATCGTAVRTCPVSIVATVSRALCARLPFPTGGDPPDSISPIAENASFAIHALVSPKTPDVVQFVVEGPKVQSNPPAHKAYQLCAKAMYATDSVHCHPHQSNQVYSPFLGFYATARAGLAMPVRWDC